MAFASAETVHDAGIDSLGAAFRPCMESGAPACLPAAQSQLSKILSSEHDESNSAATIDQSVEYLLRAGKDSAYARLLALADVVPPMENAKRGIADRLLDYRVEKASRRFCAVTAAPWRFPRDSMVRAGTDRDLPVEVRDAVAYHKSLDEAIQAEHLKGRDPQAKGDAWNAPDLYKHIVAYLRIGDVRHLDSADRMRWDSWCGTGSEALYGPKHKAVLIHALERGDFPTAMARDQDHFRIRGYLMCRGFDWEAYFLGAAFSNGRWERAPSAMRVLARYGSPVVLRRLLAVEPFRFYPGDARMHEWVEGVGTFLLGPGATLRIGSDSPIIPVGPTQAERQAWMEKDFRRDPAAAPLTVESVTAALKALMAAFDAHPYRIQGETFVRIFSQVDFPQRVEYLRKLAALPDPTARGEAEAALKKLGQSPGDRIPLQPVIFALTSKGKPFPDAGINVGPTEARKRRPEDGWGLGTGTVAGAFRLDRSRYMDLLHSYRGMRLDKSYFGDKPFNEVFFDREIPLSDPYADTIRLEIPLHRYEIRLGFPAGFDRNAEGKPRTARISLQRQPLAPRTSTASSDFPLRDRIAFPAIGDGVYRVGIQVPGLQPWWRDSVVISADRSDSVAFLPGTDAIYTARVRDGADRGRPIEAMLIHDRWGPMRRWETGAPPRAYAIGMGHEDMFQGLPPGWYTLHLECRGKQVGKGPVLKAEKRFRIPEGNPEAALALGDIWLKPVR